MNSRRNKRSNASGYPAKSAGTRCTWCVGWWRWRIFWLPGTVSRRSTAGWAARTPSPGSCATATEPLATRPCRDVGLRGHRLNRGKSHHLRMPYITGDASEPVTPPHRVAVTVTWPGDRGSDVRAEPCNVMALCSTIKLAGTYAVAGRTVMRPSTYRCDRNTPLLPVGCFDHFATLDF